MGYIAFQKGGYRHAGFTRKDLYNHIDRYRRSKVKNGDANAAINYLIGKSNNDPLFFRKYTFTSDERLEYIFWEDGQSIIDYHCFGDIVAFDSTYKKNKYNKPLVIFSGCNHHGQTVIFGSGLLSNETTETYKWLLETFVEAMGGKSPKAVTDGDLAMRDAIKTHRLCGWHLQRNACENIKNLNFLRDFKGLIYDNNDHRDFDRRWASILDKYNLVGSTWMEKTYETRAMWSHCFLRDKFFGYIRTTSQCEGINSLIRFYVNRKNTLIDFMHNLDRALKEYRNNELIAGFKSQCSEPVMITSLEASNCNKLCNIACKDLANFDEVQSELVKLVIRLQSRKKGKSTPNVDMEGINDPFVVKSKGAPSKRSSWRKKRACSNCHKYSHYYKRCPDLMQDSVLGNPCDRSETNASAKDSGFSPERFANSSRSFSVKSEHHSGPKTKVKESKHDMGHSLTNYECYNDVIDEKCDTPHVQNDVQDPLPSSMDCGNKQGSYMALFASMHRTL
nr:protein FAR1-RELATED SEQUENCE 5-like [Arachis hypogaea]